jgi:hypothetical protein
MDVDVESNLVESGRLQYIRRLSDIEQLRELA